RAGALRVDAEQLALGQYALAGVQRRLGRPAAGAVHRDLPGTGEERLAQPALEAAAGEVLGLGDEGDPALDHQRHEDRVGEGQVVAGDDRRPGVRDVFQPDDLRTPDQPQPRTENDVLQYPVEHPTSSRCRDEPTNPDHLITTHSPNPVWACHDSPRGTARPYGRRRE